MNEQNTIDFCGLTDFSGNLLNVAPEQLQLKVKQLRGGLQSQWVASVAVHDVATARAKTRFVVKMVGRNEGREADVYGWLSENGGDWLTPRLLGVDHTRPNRSFLFMEHVRTWKSWPWSDLAVVRQVLDALAWLHSKLPSHSSLVDSDYEADLVTSAASTLELFEQVMRQPNVEFLASYGRHLRKFVTRLPDVRRELLSHDQTFLHGDVHPGNVLVRGSGNARAVVLVDWENVRRGSPLEDVASWLQSLAYWEPEAHRRHDTLLRWYLAARGQATQLTRELRQRYWLAAACNGLAGALRYHLWLTSVRRTRKQRFEAAAAARDWLRIIRRAEEA